MGKKSKVIELPHIYRAREYQKGFWQAMHKEGKKRGLCVWHRRAGKDLTALNWTIVASQLRVGVYYHLLPYQNQAAKIVWDGIDGEGNRFLDYWPVELIRRVNNTDMMLELKNGSVWQLVGTDNKDRLMGTNPVGVVLSEYSLQDPEAWEYIRPILSENGGWAVFLYTPRGRNHAYDLHQLVKDNPEWYVSVQTVEDTGAVSLEAIESERAAGMEEELVQQEYYVSYTAPRFGAYYGKWMDEARKGGRIGRVDYDPSLATHTFWDLGVSDYTVIWFAQMAGQEIHLVDYYEMSGEGLEHYARVLEEKAKEWKLVYGEHWAPHDIEARELGLGKSRRETARSMGINFNVVRLSAYKRQGGPLFVTEGIEAVRKILHRCWFDEGRCAMGIKRLEQYRREWDNKMNCFRSSPLHDENSHGADGFRTLAMALKLGAGTKNALMDEKKRDRYDRKKKSSGASAWAT